MATMFTIEFPSNCLYSNRFQEQVKNISKNNNWFNSHVVIEHLKPHFVQTTKKLKSFWDVCPISKKDCTQSKEGH